MAFDCTVLILCLVMLLSNASYAVSAPFLPIMFDEKDIRESFIGFVFGAFSLALIVVSPQVAPCIEKYGQPNLLGFGFVLLGVSTIAFGYVKQVDDKNHVIYMSLGLRFIQGKLKIEAFITYLIYIGIAAAILSTCTYSFASLMYPRKKDKE